MKYGLKIFISSCIKICFIQICLDRLVDVRNTYYMYVVAIYYMQGDDMYLSYDSPRVQLHVMLSTLLSPDLKTDVQLTFNTMWSLCSLFCLHNLFKLSIMGLRETPLCNSKHNEQTSHPHCSSYICSVQFSGNLF